jgi:hypothetical protein
MHASNCNLNDSHSLGIKKVIQARMSDIVRLLSVPLWATQAEFTILAGAKKQKRLAFEKERYSDE